MQLAGHTMGVPKMDIFQAMKFFQKIGYTGMEIRCAEDGHLDPESYTSSTGRQIRKRAQTYEIDIVCLTSYYLDLVSEGIRDRTLQDYKKIIGIAHDLGCPRVRYKGILPPAGFTRETAWERTREGLKEAATFGKDLGVWICVENHDGSMTQGARDTLRMVEEINMENVGVIFDYAFIDLNGAEGIDESVDILGSFIHHVHIKDHIYDRKTGTLTKLPLGQGNINLKGLLSKLKSIGYKGFLTDEYEKYWQADLPEPEIGMRRNAKYLIKLLTEI